MRHPRLVLASGSPHRAELLARLTPDFEQRGPAVDETRYQGERAYDYVVRLAIRKAKAVAGEASGRLIIGSDQACVHAEHILGKPGSSEQAAAQLSRASGQPVTFLTSVCVLDADTGAQQADVVPTTVHFRELTPAIVARYLEREPALDAAGSIYAEGLGISLFRSVESTDPTALVGLPLICLTTMLNQNGYALP